jgi:hypothetical protein
MTWNSVADAEIRSSIAGNGCRWVKNIEKVTVGCLMPGSHRLLLGGMDWSKTTYDFDASPLALRRRTLIKSGGRDPMIVRLT